MSDLNEAKKIKIKIKIKIKEENYKEMYLMLFNKLTDISEEIKTVQLEAEEKFLSQGD